MRTSEKWKVKVRGGAEGSCLVLGYVDLRPERVDYGSVRWLSTATITPTSSGTTAPTPTSKASSLLLDFWK